MLSIIRQNGQAVYGLVEFVIDNISDVTDLPTENTAPGSTAICIENSSVYILDHNKTWREL